MPVKLFWRREVVSGGSLGRMGAGYSQQPGLEMTNCFCLLVEELAGIWSVISASSITLSLSKAEDFR